MEERKQEMPDVHQPDLSVAGEQRSRLGVPLPSHDLLPMISVFGANTEFGLSK